MTRCIQESLELIVFDFDDVLTDNRVLIMENGLEAVSCNRAEGIAFEMLHAVDMPVMILSTEKNTVVAKRAAKLRVPVLQGIGDKRQALVEYCREAGVDLARVVFIGNDVNDISIMQMVGFPIAVADAHPAVKEVAWTVLATKGGEGVARELVEQVLNLEYGTTA